MLEYFLRLLEWCKVQLLIIEHTPRDVFFKEGEVWWCSIGLNVGEEEFGKGPQFARPVLITRKFTKYSYFGIPFTGSRKSGSWYVLVNLPQRQSSLMLNQGRILDYRRLLKKITTLSDDQFGMIKRRFIELYNS